jgi:hypothetical protein
LVLTNRFVASFGKRNSCDFTKTLSTNVSETAFWKEFVTAFGKATDRRSKARFFRDNERYSEPKTVTKYQKNAPCD